METDPVLSGSSAREVRFELPPAQSDSTSGSVGRVARLTQQFESMSSVKSNGHSVGGLHDAQAQHTAVRTDSEASDTLDSDYVPKQSGSVGDRNSTLIDPHEELPVPSDDDDDGADVASIPVRRESQGADRLRQSVFGIQGGGQAGQVDRMRSVVMGEAYGAINQARLSSSDGANGSASVDDHSDLVPIDVGGVDRKEQLRAKENDLKSQRDDVRAELEGKEEGSGEYKQLKADEKKLNTEIGFLVNTRAADGIEGKDRATVNGQLGSVNQKIAEAKANPDEFGEYIPDLEAQKELIQQRLDEIDAQPPGEIRSMPLEDKRILRDQKQALLDKTDPTSELGEQLGAQLAYINQEIGAHEEISDQLVTVRDTWRGQGEAFSKSAFKKKLAAIDKLQGGGEAEVQAANMIGRSAIKMLAGTGDRQRAAGMASLTRRGVGSQVFSQDMQTISEAKAQGVNTYSRALIIDGEKEMVEEPIDSVMNTVSNSKVTKTIIKKSRTQRHEFRGRVIQANQGELSRQIPMVRTFVRGPAEKLYESSEVLMEGQAARVKEAGINDLSDDQIDSLTEEEVKQYFADIGLGNETGGTGMDHLRNGLKVLRDVANGDQEADFFVPTDIGLRALRQPLLDFSNRSLGWASHLDAMRDQPKQAVNGIQDDERKANARDALGQNDYAEFARHAVQETFDDYGRTAERVIKPTSVAIKMMIDEADVDNKEELKRDLKQAVKSENWEVIGNIIDQISG